MTESEVLKILTPPSKPRPHVWMGGVMQILITRACDLRCRNCTQLSQLGGRPMMMTPKQFETACDSLAGYPHVVGVFGGSPAISPYFEEICEIFRAKFPFRQRGLWSNNPHGKGKVMRETFNPEYSNLNVHLSQSAYDEFVRDWPESKRYLNGLKEDSRHGPPFVAMKDLDQLRFPDGCIRENTEGNRWELISTCDISANWSALIGVFRGELRAWFCEIAAAASMHHASDPDWPDTGVPVVPGWWNQGMDAFAHQARKHCHECGIPLRGFGQLAVGGGREQVSKTHAANYYPKDRSVPVEIVYKLEQLGQYFLPKSTDYIQNSHIED